MVLGAAASNPDIACKWMFGTWRSIWGCWCGFRLPCRRRYRLVRRIPIESRWGLVTALVAGGLKRTGGLLEGRGLDLRPPASISPPNVRSGLPIVRLAGKLLDGLMEHEPTLGVLLDGWSGCWLKIQGERRQLQEQAKNLYLQRRIAKELVGTLGPVAAELAIASALSLPGQGRLTAGERNDGLVTLMITGDTELRKVLVVQKAEAKPVCQANAWVVKQLLQKERIRPLKKAYRFLIESVAKIEDLVDIIILRGKPAGTCFFCPKDSRM